MRSVETGETITPLSHQRLRIHNKDIFQKSRQNFAVNPVKT